VGVRAGAPRPDISSGEALKRALLAAKSVGYSSGRARLPLRRAQALGHPESKIKQTPPGSPVGEIHRSREAEIGFSR